VKVNSFLRSSLFLYSFLGIFVQNFLLASITFFGKSIFHPHSIIRPKTSTLLSHFFHIIFFMTHSGFLHFHSFINTQTISPCFASIENFHGTKISFFILGLLGLTKPNLLFFPGKYSQTTKSVFLSITLVTSASCFHLNIFTLASTLSQSNAQFLLRQKTKNHLSIPSTSTNQKSHFH